MRVPFILLLAGLASAAQGPSVDDILQAYVKAVGGPSAIAKIQSRKAEMSLHRGAHVTLFWVSPDRALRIGGHEKQGFDGATGWEETKKKKVQKLPHGRQDELETDANPVRYVRLRDMYHELNVDKPATVDGVLMDVVSAPNALGATRFYFDHGSHLLAQIQEFGVTSAYYKHVIEFEDYKDIDGIRIPTRIERTSDEPGAEKGDVRLSHIEQNVKLDPAIFKKPDVGPIVSGGRF
jgi:hypothetical protein